MLQINTGKLFSIGVGRTNRLTGILYSNARLPHDRDAVTQAGSLRSTGSGPADLAMVYDLEERLEGSSDGPGVVVSHTVAPYLDDFAVVASFVLGAVFSREPGVVRSLTDGRPGFSSYAAPESFVPRFFNGTVYLTEDDVVGLEMFVAQLLHLERKHYLGAMRAMRTFVAGLHRIADNLGQAYTMIVSAVESLAQEFDGFTPTWSELDGRKRVPVDRALEGVNEQAANRVRAAMLASEHVALGRRYRAFAKEHLGSDFLSSATSVRPIGRYELEPALKTAYDLRSAHVHQLKSLPTPISHPHGHWETTRIERVPALTFSGLYRLSRQVIRSFVEQGPTIDREDYDYSLERSGIIEMEWAAEYWIWKPITDVREVRRRLEGLLSMVTNVLNREPDAKLADMRSALKDVERLLPQAKAEFRPALLALHFLFNLLLQPDQRSEDFDVFFEKHSAEASEPSVEGIVVGTILGAVSDWSVETYSAVLDRYFAQSVRKNGLHAPRLIEAAMCLTLAEKHRISGSLEDMRIEFRRAAEVHPGAAPLAALAAKSEVAEIDWRKILLRPADVAEMAASDQRQPDDPAN